MRDPSPAAQTWQTIDAIVTVRVLASQSSSPRSYGPAFHCKYPPIDTRAIFLLLLFSLSTDLVTALGYCICSYGCSQEEDWREQMGRFHSFVYLLTRWASYDRSDDGNGTVTYNDARLLIFRASGHAGVQRKSSVTNGAVIAQHVARVWVEWSRQVALIVRGPLHPYILHGWRREVLEKVGSRLWGCRFQGCSELSLKWPPARK